jgi:hypothetical protein
MRTKDYICKNLMMVEEQQLLRATGFTVSRCFIAAGRCRGWAASAREYRAESADPQLPVYLESSPYFRLVTFLPSTLIFGGESLIADYALSN